jgi:8-oxo-dGTP pyrophosphatase MutT (NUDIX family)
MTTAVEPVPAATLLLLRDGAGGLEVLMIRRPDSSSFAAGALVFPGGAVHREDAADAIGARCRGLAALDPGLAASAVGAIRECFEECGILLARRAGAATPIGGADHRALIARYQLAVAAQASAWLDMMLAEDLALDCDLLVPFAHWITPAARPKRFDTRFFVAPAPVDQVAAHDRREAVDAIWLRPAEAVAGADDGRYRVVFATRMNLLKLANSATVEAALAAARVAPIVAVSPRLEQRADGPVLCIPLEAGYGVECVPADKIPRA